MLEFLIMRLSILTELRNSLRYYVTTQNIVKKGEIMTITVILVAIILVFRVDCPFFCGGLRGGGGPTIA